MRRKIFGTLRVALAVVIPALDDPESTVKYYSTTKCTRRFLAQASSLLLESTGRSSP